MALIEHMTSFNQLNLHTDLLRNLALLGYQGPTPIQEEAIPVIMEGHDVLGTAQTGTGKTAAFTLPLINRLLNTESLKRSPKVLILAPTRELCSQILASVEGYAKDTAIKSTAIYGGVGQGAQTKAIQAGVHIIVATPGRLQDLVSQRLLKLTEIEAFVIDEADRMLDMGFIDDIKNIINLLPKKRQTLLFSATMPDEITRLSARILKNPQSIEVARKDSVASNIDQRVIFCKQDHKFGLLKKIIKEEATGLVLVFTKTKMTADCVVEYLAQNRMASRAIHGDKNQSDRERSIEIFHEKGIKVLVATDLVSRGIDVEGVGHVINFDLPLDPEAYVHRIGRTARAGKSGVAISFCDISEKHRLTDIENLINQKIASEKFEGKNEPLKFKSAIVKPVIAPTPGRSQEKNSWLDHSKRQRVDENGKKIHVNPAFKNKKKRKR